MQVDFARFLSRADGKLLFSELHSRAFHLDPGQVPGASDISSGVSPTGLPSNSHHGLRGRRFKTKLGCVFASISLKQSQVRGRNALVTGRFDCWVGVGYNDHVGSGGLRWGQRWIHLVSVFNAVLLPVAR